MGMFSINHICSTILQLTPISEITLLVGVCSEVLSR